MARKFLDIHVEGFKNEDELKRIAEERIPCYLFIIPGRLGTDYYPDNAVEWIGRCLEKKAILGQQGLNHTCRNKHDFSDKAHEMWCPYGRALSLEEQREIMGNGREILKRFFGKTPLLFVPPNHLYDRTTLEAADETGYYFFGERALINVHPYPFGRNLIVEPEVKIGKDGKLVYVHYGDIDNNREAYEKVVENARRGADIIIHRNPPVNRKLNFQLVRGMKYLWDLKNLPGRIK